MFHFPKIQEENLQKKFDKFEWDKTSKFLSFWQKGKTGYPIVDAGMRELWQTGYMHNRVRMITGSFLVKNLLVHWKPGENWFSKIPSHLFYHPDVPQTLQERKTWERGRKNSHIRFTLRYKNYPTSFSLRERKYCHRRT